MGAATGTPPAEPGRPTAAVRVAAANLALLGAAFGGGAIWAVTHLRRTGELPMTPFGFRALSGPFEQLGTGSFSILAVALAAVCAVQGLAANLALAG